MDLWPPSAEPMAQGLPSSPGLLSGLLFGPLRNMRPMGWIGGRYTTLKPIPAMEGSQRSQSANVPCAPGFAAVERGKNSYHELKRARTGSTAMNNSCESVANRLSG